MDGYTESLFDKESIYEFRILFQGKLEGENEVRKIKYKDILYADSSKRRLIIGRDATIYNDLPEPFKEIIKEFYKNHYPNLNSDYLRQQATLPNEFRDAKFKKKY